MEFDILILILYNSDPHNKSNRKGVEMSVKLKEVLMEEPPSVNQIRFEDPMNMVGRNIKRAAARILRGFKILFYVNQGTEKNPNWGVICLLDGKGTYLPICTDGLYNFIFAPARIWPFRPSKKDITYIRI